MNKMHVYACIWVCSITVTLKAADKLSKLNKILNNKNINNVTLTKH